MGVGCAQGSLRCALERARSSVETYYHVSSYHVSSVVLNPGTELRRSAYAENGFFKFVGILYASAEDHVEALLFADLLQEGEGE